jgi:hypothetical protein
MQKIAANASWVRKPIVEIVRENKWTEKKTYFGSSPGCHHDSHNPSCERK